MSLPVDRLMSNKIAAHAEFNRLAEREAELNAELQKILIEKYRLQGAYRELENLIKLAEVSDSAPQS